MESSQTLCEEGLLFFPFYPGETEAKEVNNLPKVVRLEAELVQVQASWFQRPQVKPTPLFPSDGTA